ncbi:hypothetical protein D0469_03020 [Peribacillus saganii]|uniref:Uncharacterized protein n=1 Tax=Peribacillus saganii TaxID=2303992 RepID=A0A372LSA6_9BACI|nr:hypothetical protein D0469_03020 [Peribacillus saganii]
MKLKTWSFARRNTIKAIFDEFPNSLVIFRRVKYYYFVYTVDWSAIDPPVSRDNLEEMEWLINKELDHSENYRNRKFFKSD